MLQDHCSCAYGRRLALFLMLNIAGHATTVSAAMPRWLHSLKVWADSADVNNCDTSFVWLPREGFTAYFNSYLSGLRQNLSMSTLTAGGTTTDVSGFFRSKPTLMASVAMSYRGWGLSYSHDLLHSDDTEMAYTFYGQRYGAEFRIHNSYSLTGKLEGEDTHSPTYVIDEQSGRMRVLLANVYYVFDYRHFSHPAVTSHTTLQRRSAGSWLAILNYYHCSFRSYGDDMPDCLKRISQSHVNVGAGYAYNYVFDQQHWVLHGSLMPMLSMWQRDRLYYETYGKSVSYDVSFSTVTHIHLVGNYGRYLTGLQSIYNLDVMTGLKDFSSRSHNWTVRAFFGVRF